MYLKRKRIVLVLLCSLGMSISSYAQVKFKKEDQDKVDEMNEVAKKGDSLLFMKLYLKNFSESKASKNYFLLSYSYSKYAIFCYYRNRIKKGIPYLDTAIQISSQNNLEEVTLALLMNRGAFYYTIGNYSSALNDYKASEVLMVKNKSSRIGGLLGNISLLYTEIGDLEKAKKYLYRSIPFVKLDTENDAYVKSLNNLGLIFKKEKNYIAADSVFRIGYALSKEKKLDSDFSDVLYNLVEVLTIQNKIQEAKTFNEELLPHVIKTKDASWVKLVILDHANLNYRLGNITEAKKYLLRAEQIKIDETGREIQDLDMMSVAATLYLNLGYYEKSARMFAAYYESEGRNTKQNETLNLQELTYNYEKRQDSLAHAKEKEIIALESLHEKEKAETKLHQQQIILGVSLIGLICIVVFSLFLVKANRSKQKANNEITFQKGLLTEKNKEITDSINYAKRIQHSLLPPIELLEILLPKHFLVYMPKDIVSGDFFWAKKLNANEIFIAVADCTGHGVPGAMMSALSIQNLNELSMQTRSVSELLSLLNTNLKHTLNQDQEGFSKDGLDICLCKINAKERKITYSGANRSLQIFNQNGLKQEVKATKNGIAGHTLDSQVYAEHEIVLEENDMVVMSTDGFADQFGGPENKKITTKRFKEWMTEIIFSDNKKAELEARFGSWKGSTDQIDDVCVLGFKI